MMNIFVDSEWDLCLIRRCMCGTLREVAGHCGKVRDSIGSGGTAGIAGVVGVARYYRALVGRRNEVFRVIDCCPESGSMSTARRRGEL